MKLLLSEIPEGHGHLERTVPSETLELGVWIRPHGLARVVLETDRRGQQATLRGDVEVEGGQECGRCLREILARITAQIVVLADRRGTQDPRDEEALEQDGEVLYHEGVELDLGPAIREAVILEVPQVVLCRPDCRGLCPRCGQDLNEADCGCNPVGSDPRWDRLKSLKDPKPEEPR